MNCRLGYLRRLNLELELGMFSEWSNDPQAHGQGLVPHSRVAATFFCTVNLWIRRNEKHVLLRPSGIRRESKSQQQRLSCGKSKAILFAV